MLLSYFSMESMCYVTFELLCKFGQGLLVCFNIKSYRCKLFHTKSEVNPDQAEGNVDSRLYGRGRCSN